MTIDREIKYNRYTHDFDCFVDGRYVGSRANYRDGDELCNQVAYDLLADGMALTAAELDGDPPEGPIILDEAPTDEPPWPLMRMSEGDVLDADGMRVAWPAQP